MDRKRVIGYLQYFSENYKLNNLSIKTESGLLISAKLKEMYLTENGIDIWKDQIKFSVDFEEIILLRVQI